MYGNGERADRRDRASAGGGRADRARSPTCAAPPSRAPAGRCPTAGPRSTRATVDTPGPVAPPPIRTPIADASRRGCAPADAPAPALPPARLRRAPRAKSDRARTVIRLPDFDAVAADPVLYAHASRAAAPRDQPGQRARAGAAPRRPRRLAEPAAAAAVDRRRWTRVYELPVHAPPAPALRRRQDPRLRDDPLLGHHHARLLRRLHLLLDHRARGPDHPEPLGGVGPARDRDACATPSPGSPASSPTWAARPPTCTASPARARRSRRPAGCRRACYPAICPNLEHRPRAADQPLPQGARGAGRQEGPDRLGRALRPGGDLARVRARSWPPTTSAAT